MKKNIIIIILIFVFVIVLLFLDLPSYNKVASLKAEIKNYQESLRDKEELLIKVDQLKEVYNNRKNAISKVSFVLPDSKAIPGLIVQIESLTSENGLILEGINFTEKKVKKATRANQEDSGVQPNYNHKTLNVSLRLNGGYLQFKGFLEALELNVRIMDLKKITISSEEDEEGNLIFTYNLDLEVYYQ